VICSNRCCSFAQSPAEAALLSRNLYEYRTMLRLNIFPILRGSCRGFILQRRVVGSLESCILVICAAIWGRALTGECNANSRRYCQPDGDYQLPCQLHPVQGRRAHAGSVDSAAAKPLAPFFLPSAESRARPDRKLSYLITTIYHQVSAPSL